MRLPCNGSKNKRDDINAFNVYCGLVETNLIPIKKVCTQTMYLKNPRFYYFVFAFFYIIVKNVV